MTSLRKISFWVYRELIKISMSLLFNTLIPGNFGVKIESFSLRECGRDFAKEDEEDEQEGLYLKFPHKEIIITRKI